MFEASRPVTNTMSTVRIAPMPGTRLPNSASGCHAGGRSSSDWSIVLTRKWSTQIVMTSGIQIRSPVMR
jgi:hypothetical protein